MGFEFLILVNIYEFEKLNYVYLCDEELIAGLVRTASRGEV